MNQYKQIVTDGLWRNNPGLIQFLGICPLLAVSNSAINGIGLGVATLAVLTLSNLIVSLLRPWIATDVRLPIFVLVIASLVTAVELLSKAWFFDLWLSLGIFLPLIVTNCVILARAEAFASRHTLLEAAIDGLAHGSGFAGVLIVLGSVREILGTGRLFANADMLLGNSAAAFEIEFPGFGDGFLLAMLPPGAFLGLALIVALSNLIRRDSVREPPPSESSRASATES